MSTIQIFPSAGNAGVACDASLYWDGSGTSFTTTRNNPTSTFFGASYTTILTSANTNVGDANSDVWRSALTFDTSVLAGATITSATFNIARDGTYQATVYDPFCVLVAYTGITTGFTTNEYNITNYGSTQLSSNSCHKSTGFDTLADGGYFSYTLNASGLANINQSGVSGFALRDSNDVSGIPKLAGGSGGSQDAYLWRSADAVSSQPYLEINYTLSTITDCQMVGLQTL